MINTSAVQPHNERSAAVWNSGGSNYDRISRSIADSLEHCVMRLDPKPGERILDLATGTGWTSRLVARRGATVTGVDIAGSLLDAARENASRENLSISYQLADAEELPSDNAIYEAVVSTYGVMFASRPEAAAAEIARVCRKGGRLAITTWFKEGNVFQMFKIMKQYMPPPASPAPPSPFEWGHVDRIRELLGGAFDLRFESGVSFYREPSAEAAWETLSTGYGPTKMLVASLDPDRREALRRQFIAFHAGFATDLGICVPREYVLAVGVRR